MKEKLLDPIMAINKQKAKVKEAMETATIVQSLQSKYELSLELLKLNTLEPMDDNKIMAIRTAYGLNSAVWIMAEKEFENNV